MSFVKIIKGRLGAGAGAAEIAAFTQKKKRLERLGNRRHRAVACGGGAGRICEGLCGYGNQ